MSKAQETAARRRANWKLSELSARYHEGLALDEINNILVAEGFNELEPAIYCGRDGRSNEQVGNSTYISLIWHKMEVTGRYEITVYLS